MPPRAVAAVKTAARALATTPVRRLATTRVGDVTRARKARRQRKRIAAPPRLLLLPKNSARFLAVALTLMIALYALYYYPHAPQSVFGRSLTAYVEVQAKLAGALVAVFDRDARTSGTVISGPIPIKIVRDCSSLDIQALFAAAVLAFPTRWIDKLRGLLVGIVLLTCLNLVRIAGLHFVGALAPQFFDTAHEEVFPLLLLTATLSLFVAWIVWASHPTRGGQPASANAD